MNLRLPAELEQRIQSQLAQGNYQSEADVVRDALDALDARNDDLSAIQAGVEDMEAGRTRPLKEVTDEILKKHGQGQ